MTEPFALERHEVAGPSVDSRLLQTGPDVPVLCRGNEPGGS